MVKCLETPQYLAGHLQSSRIYSVAEYDVWSSEALQRFRIKGLADGDLLCICLNLGWNDVLHVLLTSNGKKKWGSEEGPSRLNHAVTKRLVWARPDAGSYDYWQRRAQTYEEAPNATTLCVLCLIFDATCCQVAVKSFSGYLQVQRRGQGQVTTSETWYTMLFKFWLWFPTDVWCTLSRASSAVRSTQRRSEPPKEISGRRRRHAVLAMENVQLEVRIIVAPGGWLGWLWMFEFLGFRNRKSNIMAFHIWFHISHMFYQGTMGVAHVH